MALCSIEDIKAQMTNVTAEIASDPQLEMMRQAAEAEVYAYITPFYHTSCPFADPAPPLLRWDCARLAYGMLISGQTGPNEPNKSDYGTLIMIDVKKDLEKIVNCEKGLYTVAGILIQRDVPCPEGSPNSGASTTNVIVSKTGIMSEKDITIFSLRDVPEK